MKRYLPVVIILALVLLFTGCLATPNMVSNFDATPTTSNIVPSQITLVDEFLGGNATSGSIGELGWLKSANDFIGWDGSVNHPGMVMLGNSFTVPSVNTLSLSSASSIARTVIPQDIAYMALVMTPNSGTSLIAFRFGLEYLISSSLETTQGIYFSFNAPVSNKWRTVTRNAINITTNTTSTFYANGTWYLLEIIKNGANYEFWINGVLQFSHSTNIPTVYCTPVIAFEVLAGGLNNQNVNIDYFMMKSVNTLVRYP